MASVVVTLGLLSCAAACSFELRASPGVPIDGAGDADGDHDAPSDAPPDAGCESPAADWQFNEGTGLVAADRSGHGNTLALTNAGWNVGHEGSALDLTGSNSFASMPYNATFQATRALSITAWVFPETLANGGIAVKSSRGGAVQDWGFYKGGSELNTLYNWPSGSVSGSSTGLALPLSTWTHVVLVLDVDAGTSSYYKNGMLVSASPMTVPLLQNNAVPISLGTDAGSSISDFDGRIDSVTIWTRALSVAEIGVLRDGACITLPP